MPHPVLCWLANPEEEHHQGGGQKFPDEENHSEHYISSITQIGPQVCLQDQRQDT